MMHRGQALARAIAVLFTFALVGCGGAAPAPSSSAPAASAAAAAKPSGAAPSAAAATNASGAAPSAALQKVLDAAKAEVNQGPLFVSITQPNQEATYQAMFAAFNKRFGLDVKFQWQSHQQDYYPKVITEAQAGRKTPDLISGSTDNMTTLDKEGLIESFDWAGTFGQDLPGIDDSVGRVLPVLKNKALAHFDVIYVPTYNTTMVSADKVPKTVDDLVAPQWDRKFAQNSHGAPIDSLGVGIGEAKALDLAQKIKANHPIYANGAPGVVQSVASGQAALGFGYTTGADLAKSQGAPIEWAPLTDYIPLLQQDLTVLKSAQHPNLARLFAAWTVTEGMAIQEKMEFMGRVTAKGTPTANKIQQIAPKAQIVDIKTPEQSNLRLKLTDEIGKIFTS